MLPVEVLRVRKERVTWRDVDGEVVGLNLPASTYFSANPSGSLLWPLLVAGTTRAEMTDRLVGSFEIDPERAASDVEAYVVSLDELGLLEH